MAERGIASLGVGARGRAFAGQEHSRVPWKELSPESKEGLLCLTYIGYYYHYCPGNEDTNSWGNNCANQRASARRKGKRGSRPGRAKGTLQSGSEAECLYMPTAPKDMDATDRAGSDEVSRTEAGRPLNADSR